MVFFHLRPLETPFVAPEERYSVSRLGIPYCYRLIVRHGYMDEVLTPDLASLIYQQLRDFIIRRGEYRGVPNTTITIPTPVLPLTTSSAPAQDDREVRSRSISFIDPSSNPTTDRASSTPSPSAVPAPVPSSPSSPSPPIHIAFSTLIEDKDTPTTSSTSALSPTPLELNKLEEAYTHQVLYIIGKEQLRIKTGTNWFRGALLAVFLCVRENTRTKIANLKVPVDKVVEVGFVKDV